MPGRAYSPRLEALRGVLRDPVRFVPWVGRSPLSGQQEGLLQAVTEHPLVVVPKGHSTGGTYAMAGLALQLLAQHKRVKVLITGPTWISVETTLIGDIHGLLLSAADKLDFPTPTKTGVHVHQHRFVKGLSTNDVNRFSGHHADQLWIVIDEAPGVRPEVWQAVEGLRASGDVHVVALGQPHSPAGEFYECTKPGSGWHVYRMDCFDSPNLKGLDEHSLLELSDRELDRVVHPKLVRRRWVRDMIVNKGIDHPHYQTKVRARFPSEDKWTLYKLAHIERAQTPALDPGGPIDVGIDVAGPGRNETVCTLYAPPVIVAQEFWRGMDARGEVAAMLAAYKARIRRVRVDVGGIGFYFVQHLTDLGYNCTAVNFGVPSRDERFLNMRSEILWSVREALERDAIQALTDEETRAQMAPMRWANDPRGRIVVESKQGSKHAWDRIDSLGLAVWVPQNENIMPYDGPLYGKRQSRSTVGSLRKEEW